jgi:hypothetical protein
LQIKAHFREVIIDFIEVHGGDRSDLRCYQKLMPEYHKNDLYFTQTRMETELQCNETQYKVAMPCFIRKHLQSKMFILAWLPRRPFWILSKSKAIFRLHIKAVIKQGIATLYCVSLHCKCHIAMYVASFLYSLVKRKSTSLMLK